MWRLIIMSVFHQKPVTHINHVALKVADLARSLDFYENVLKMQVLKKVDNEVQLTADGVTAIVKLIEIEDAETSLIKTTGLYHIAFLLPTRIDLAHFLQHIMNEKIPFGASDHHVSEALYLQDPDGNGIEVYVDRPSESWVWVHEQVTMATERLNTSDLLELQTGAWESMPASTVIGHLHLHVSHLDEAKVFFTALGFTVVNEFHGAIFMSAGKYHHHIACNIWNGPAAISPSEHQVGLQSFSILYNDVAVRNAVIEQLERLHVKVTVKSAVPCIQNSPYGEIMLKV